MTNPPSRPIGPNDRPELPGIPEDEVYLACDMPKLAPVVSLDYAKSLLARVEQSESRRRFWMEEAKGIARDRAELMNAGERYPQVVAELRTALEQRLGVNKS